jgi:hypothetical protein
MYPKNTQEEIQMSEMYHESFPENFVETERGNTWLMGDDDRHYILIGLDVDEDDNETSQYLELYLDPNNYPGFTMQPFHTYNEELKKVIQSDFIGWSVRRWNLPFDCPVDEVNEIVEEEEVA